MLKDTVKNNSLNIWNNNNRESVMYERGDDGGQLPTHVNTKVVTRRINTCLWSWMLMIEVVIYGSYSIFVNLSEENGKLPYNTAAVVVLIELVKFITSAILYLPECKRRQYNIPYIPWLYALSYSIPAVLYTINNNLGISMQLYMDPTTYQVLSNMKIAITAILYKVIIRRKTSRSQWASVVLLTVAGFCHSASGFEWEPTSGNKQRIFITLTGLVLITTYCTISGLAAVYTEYIMKHNFTISLHLQNLMLYTYGLVFNFGTFLWQSHHTKDTEYSGFLTGFSTYTWLIVISQASNGLIMSIVMKHGSNLTRLFIISGAMLTSTLMAYLVFNTVINVSFILAALLVIIAIYLYHR